MKSSNKLFSMVSGQSRDRSRPPTLVLSCAARVSRIMRICKRVKSEFAIIVEGSVASHL